MGDAGNSVTGCCSCSHWDLKAHEQMQNELLVLQVVLSAFTGGFRILTRPTPPSTACSTPARSIAVLSSVNFAEGGSVHEEVPQLLFSASTWPEHAHVMARLSGGAIPPQVNVCSIICEVKQSETSSIHAPHPAARRDCEQSSACTEI